MRPAAGGKGHPLASQLPVESLPAQSQGQTGSKEAPSPNLPSQTTTAAVSADHPQQTGGTLRDDDKHLGRATSQDSQSREDGVSRLAPSHDKPSVHAQPDSVTASPSRSSSEPAVENASQPTTVGAVRHYLKQQIRVAFYKVRNAWTGDDSEREQPRKSRQQTKDSTDK